MLKQPPQFHANICPSSMAVAMPGDQASAIAADAAQHCSDVTNPDARERCREQRSNCRESLRDAR
jgi:hypothetical protein